MTAQSPALPQQGSILAGRYVLGRPLGKGAMGVVYEAELKRLEQRVAIKVLRPEILAEPGLVARFEREARLIAKLTSDNIVRVIDVDTTDDGLPFLVMERLEGTDLSTMLRSQGPFEIARAVDVVRQICSGMADAHRAGVIHRDLKPSNIFVIRREGSQDIQQEIVKVVDFGVSKLVGDSQMTATESTLGTPRYMSPEQIRSAKSVDERTDVWSMAVILFELLAGKPPFYGESATGVAAAIVVDDPLSLRSLRPDVPEWLEQVIMAGLVKNPAQRIQTAAALRAALDPASAHRASLAGVPMQQAFAGPPSISGLAQPVAPIGLGPLGPLPPLTPLTPLVVSPGAIPAAPTSSPVSSHPSVQMEQAPPSFSVPPGPTEASWAQAPKASLRPPTSRNNIALFVALFVLTATGLTALLIILRHPSVPSNATDASSLVVAATPTSAATPKPLASAPPTDPPPRQTASAALSASPPPSATHVAKNPDTPPTSSSAQKPLSGKLPPKDCPDSQKILVGSKLVCP